MPISCVAAQVKQEAEWLLRLMRDYNFGNSILEIGSHNGGMLALMAYSNKTGSKVRAIDNTDQHGILTTIAHLKDDGYDAEAYISDSKAPEAIFWAAKNGPYDFVFIDGDHSPQGVNSDWRNYGHMGKWVGFHDIKQDVPAMGTFALWNELKNKYPSIEFNMHHDSFGIGIIKMPTYGVTYIHDGARSIKFSFSA
jgi:hypothetical protein